MKLCPFVGAVDASLMPPTRGHDLKHFQLDVTFQSLPMPPTRGHDLKPSWPSWPGRAVRMPPTRGHDLKHFPFHLGENAQEDAPHTGARLETAILGILVIAQIRCPPHGGTT